MFYLLKPQPLRGELMMRRNGDYGEGECCGGEQSGEGD